MLTREALEALPEPCRNMDAGEFEPVFLLRSMNEVKEAILLGFRSLSKMDRVAPSSPNVVRVGESWTGGSARCSSLDSKNAMLSSKESDFGRGIAPFTAF